MGYSTSMGLMKVKTERRDPLSMSMEISMNTALMKIMRRVVDKDREDHPRTDPLMSQEKNQQNPNPMRPQQLQTQKQPLILSEEMRLIFLSLSSEARDLPNIMAKTSKIIIMNSLRRKINLHQKELNIQRRKKIQEKIHQKRARQLKLKKLRPPQREFTQQRLLVTLSGARDLPKLTIYLRI